MPALFDRWAARMHVGGDWRDAILSLWPILRSFRPSSTGGDWRSLESGFFGVSTATPVGVARAIAAAIERSVRPILRRLAAMVSLVCGGRSWHISEPEGTRNKRVSTCAWQMGRQGVRSRLADMPAVPKRSDSAGTTQPGGRNEAGR